MTNSDTKTENAKLVTTDTAYVGPDGAFSKPNAEYDFSVGVTSSGEQLLPNTFASYHLDACIYTFSPAEISINLEAHSTLASTQNRRAIVALTVVATL